MSLQEIKFEFNLDNFNEPGKEWTHVGVVGSGDLEILIEKKDFGGRTRVKVLTPTKGYEKVWQIVMERFVNQSRLGNVTIEINDNYATPLVVTTRLRQALEDLNSPETKG